MHSYVLKNTYFGCMIHIRENGGEIMKYGMRKPSIKRSVKARTTSRIKRSVQKSINPLYGKKGMGWIKNPKRAAYNKIYK